MEFKECLYVEINLAGKLEEIFEETKNWVKNKKFKIKKELTNKSLKVFLKAKELSRSMDLTFETTEKGTLVIINEEFEDAKVRGEIFTLREDVNGLVGHLQGKFESLDKNK